MSNSAAKVTNTLADKLVEIERLREELAAAQGQLEAAGMPVHNYNEGGIVHAVYGSSSINYVDWLREQRDTAFLRGVKAALEVVKNAFTKELNTTNWNDTARCMSDAIQVVEDIDPATIEPIEEQKDV